MVLLRRWDVTCLTVEGLTFPWPCEALHRFNWVMRHCKLQFSVCISYNPAWLGLLPKPLHILLWALVKSPASNTHSNRHPPHGIQNGSCSSSAPINSPSQSLDCPAPPARSLQGPAPLLLKDTDRFCPSQAVMWSNSPRLPNWKQVHLKWEALRFYLLESRLNVCPWLRRAFTVAGCGFEEINFPRRQQKQRKWEPSFWGGVWGLGQKCKWQTKALHTLVLQAGLHAACVQQPGARFHWDQEDREMLPEPCRVWTLQQVLNGRASSRMHSPSPGLQPAWEDQRPASLRPMAAEGRDEGSQHQCYLRKSANIIPFMVYLL